MSSNYTIIIDKIHCHEDYVCHIFRSIMYVPKSIFNRFIKNKKNKLETVIDIRAVENVGNDTNKYNKMV